MIVMDIKLDNFLAFQNFSMNMSYPKKIVNSYIRDEFLSGRPNFRYKKVVILMGANATGKTSLGQMLNNIFIFMLRNNTDSLVSSVCDKAKRAFLSVDFVLKNTPFMLYRIEVIIEPEKKPDIFLKRVKILYNDNYEKACERFNLKAESLTLQDIPTFGFFFSHPVDYSPNVMLIYSTLYRQVLENILRTLDPAITRVEEVSEAKNAYNIYMANGQNVLIQEGQVVNTTLLSSGTKAGIGIAAMLTAMKEGKCGFYYCDERFSYIQSNVECSILALMSDFLHNDEQLFFTTHNTEILDRPFPKHSFSFLRKDNDCRISCVNAADFLKRNTDSVGHAFRNDLFSISPSIELLENIREL